MLKKIALSGVGLILLATPLLASADTTSDLLASLQAQVKALLAQISALQAQSGGGQSFCHNFNTDLTFGSSGAEVSALNQALSLTKLTLNDNVDNSVFNENTAADVVSFQAQYGIRQTGYVGPLTRAQLNKLYECSFSGATPLATTTPTISGFSPSQATTNDTLTIYGTNFSSGDNPSVEFYASSGSLIATMPFVSMSSISDQRIVFPLANIGITTSGTYQIKVVTRAGRSNPAYVPLTVSNPNTQTTSAAPTAPVIQALSFGKDLTYGTGKYIYTIEGKNFSNVASVKEEHLVDGLTTIGRSALVYLSDTKIVFGSRYSTNQSYSDYYESSVKVVDKSGQESNPLSVRIDVRDAAAKVVPIITVVSPNGNSWQSGTAQTIQWADSAYANDAYYTVFATQKNGNAYGIIANNVHGTSVLWTVGKLYDSSPLPSLAAGESSYYVQVVRQASGASSSNSPFTITAPVTPVPTLTSVTLPNGAIYTAGGNIQVNWAESVRPSSVQIMLNGTVSGFASVVLANINNMYAGDSYAWGGQIPATVPSGNYTISVCDSGVTNTVAPGKPLCGNSSQFSITGSSPKPDVTLSAPTSVTSGQSPTITWSSKDATYCTLTTGSIGDYGAGAAPLKGSMTIDPVTSNRTVKLTCNGAGGSTTQSVVMAVTAATAAPTDPSVCVVSPAYPKVGDTVTWSINPAHVTSYVDAGNYVIDSYFGSDANYLNNTHYGSFNGTNWLQHQTSKTMTYSSPGTQYAKLFLLTTYWASTATVQEDCSVYVGPAVTVSNDKQNQMANSLAALESALRAALLQLNR
ncbi:MAG: peptidoglycan-binding protein [bacterium]|nr:peptidoglycan-binding protein [bacterium]